MSIEETISKKISIREFGRHLAAYFDLYTKPVNVWRKVISNRSTSYNLVILHIVYYTFFVLLLIQKSYSFSIFYVALEIGITIIPFLIFFLPFKIFTSLFKKKLKWNRLFRLFIIIKLQFLPILILIILFAQWSDNEDPYIIVENLIWILWLALMFIFPILLSIKLWQKALWILSNYICFLVFLMMVGIAVSQISNSDSLIDKISVGTPNSEYNNSYLKRSLSEVMIADDYLILLLRKPEGEMTKLIRTQFVSHQLLKSFKITDANQTRKRIKDIDSLKRISDTTRLGKTWIDSLTFYPKNEELTLKKLDSLKREFDRLFTNDLKLMALLKDSAKFQSNRTYFSAFYDYLDNYQRIFIDEDILSKVLSKHGNEAEIISLGDYYYVSLDKIDSTFYIDKKKNYLELETQLEERADKANFIASIMLFPLDKISDLFDYEE